VNSTNGAKRRKRFHRYWTAEEEAFLKGNFVGQSIQALADALGRPKPGVARRLGQLGLKTRYYGQHAGVPEGHKFCWDCEQIKPHGDFHRSGGSKDGRQSRCKPCAVAYAVKWNKDHPDRFKYNSRTSRLRRRYGLTRAEFDVMLVQAGHRCPVCLVELTASNVATDHDHDTLKVRGVLCRQCNTAIGGLNDSIVQLERAIEYLRAAEQDCATLGLSQAAAMAGMTYSALRWRAAKGHLRAEKRGRRWVVGRPELAHFVERYLPRKGSVNAIHQEREDGPHQPTQ
jgi:hypothetical protein